METIKDIISFVVEFKKTVITLLLVVSLAATAGYYRIPSWWHSVVVSYELEKTTEFRWLTGACVVNMGTDLNENWVPCSRVFGAAGGEGEVVE